MIVSEIIEDLQLILRESPDTRDYRIAVVAHEQDDPETTKIVFIEAFHWDEDKEFFFLPQGTAKVYQLPATEMTAQTLLTTLSALDENIRDYTAYTRARLKILEDGRIASLSFPLISANIYHDEKLICFYH